MEFDLAAAVLVVDELLGLEFVGGDEVFVGAVGEFGREQHS